MHKCSGIYVVFARRFAQYAFIRLETARRCADDQTVLRRGYSLADAASLIVDERRSVFSRGVLCPRSCSMACCSR